MSLDLQDTNKMPQEIHQHVEQTNKQEALRIPYDTRPMESTLLAGERITLHGGITIANQTSGQIFIREDFLLYKGGYHLTIIDPETGALLVSAFQTPMNTTYFFLIQDGLPTLEKVESIPHSLIAID